MALIMRQCQDDDDYFRSSVMTEKKVTDTWIKEWNQA